MLVGKINGVFVGNTMGVVGVISVGVRLSAMLGVGEGVRVAASEVGVSVGVWVDVGDAVGLVVGEAEGVSVGVWVGVMGL